MYAILQRLLRIPLSHDLSQPPTPDQDELDNAESPPASSPGTPEPTPLPRFGDCTVNYCSSIIMYRRSYISLQFTELQENFQDLKSKRDSLLARVAHLNIHWKNSPYAIDPLLILKFKTLESEVVKMSERRGCLIATKEAAEREREILRARHVHLINTNLSVSAYLAFEAVFHLLFQLQEDIEKAVGVLKLLTSNLHSSII
jgi:hypothetical protein